ncbi:MAG TPA: AAA family ATPase [Streptosporangiaceae bacterium]|nr:AAA family ATPase [Streptosporangiaceae bacterium]
MIHKVWLRQWKAYDSLDLDLGEGTTFLIAENGIGKSSIVQGLYFALFGSPLMFGTDRPTADAVRGGDGTMAVVGCDISLGSNKARLERTIQRSSRNPEIQASIQINGQAASEKEWMDLLRAETGVDAAQLALLAFVHEGATMSVNDAGLNIVGMLSEVFGVGRLRRAARQCEINAKRLDRENDSLRKSLRDSPSRRDAEQLVDLEVQRDQMTARLHALRSQQYAAERYVHIREVWAEYAASKLRFERAQGADRERVVSLIRRITDFVKHPYREADLPANRFGLERVAALISERYEQLIADHGRIEAKRETALHYAAILGTGEPKCPTCLQPLSQEAAEHALTSHQEIIQQSLAELQAVDRDLDLFRHLIRDAQELLRIPESEPPALPGEEIPENTADVSIEMLPLQAEIDHLMHEIHEVETELRVIQRADEDRKQNALLSARLLDGYGAAERAQLAAVTMTTLADVICADRIAPMADELQKRWPTLCSGSQLHMDPTGALSLEEGSYVIPYSNLSGGQRTLAQLTVRLLALQMATECPFFILDEPLEHLDSRNRRSLAALLVHAAHESSQLRQVLVTTYEESVTRRLSSVPNDSRANKGGLDGGLAARVVRISATRKD